MLKIMSEKGFEQKHVAIGFESKETVDRVS